MFLKNKTLKQNSTKILIHIFTVLFTTSSSVLETFLLFNTFNINIIGTFFIIQSATFLGASFVSFRIKEVSQLLLSNRKISSKNREDSFSELYAFYVIVLLFFIPFGFLILIIFRQFFVDDIWKFFPSIFLVMLTFIFNQLSGFWFAIQYQKNYSEKISFYQTYKKVSSLLLISFLFILRPNQYMVFTISLFYFLNAFFFFLYEFKEVSKILNIKTILSFNRPFYTLRKYIFSDNEISLALRTGYLRTLFSTWAKNGDISIAAIIAGPTGSALLKAIKSVSNLIFQFTNYTESFFMSYLERNSLKGNSTIKYLSYKSIILLPFAFVVSILSYYFSNLFFILVYKIQLNNIQSFSVSIIFLIAFFVVIFSWVSPLFLLNNKHKLIMKISFLGTGFTYILFVLAFYINSLIPLYFALPIGRFTGTIIGIFLTKRLSFDILKLRK